ncbi:MAG: hypothetical protein IT281_03765 [Ignavibacteria bacterium]|nr:hypothetical protein [Ignavibacteria bacterium]
MSKFALMTKEQISKAIKALQNISIDFKIDYVFFTGKCIIRAIVLNNPDDMSKVKSILDGDFMKNLKMKKSKEWYLGDQKEVIYMQLKKKIEISIADYEEFLVNNYA